MKSKEIAELLAMGTEYLEIFKSTLPLLTDAGAELKPIIEQINKFRVETICNAFDMYLEHGFTREEAMLLTINSKAALSEAVNNLNSKK